MADHVTHVSPLSSRDSAAQPAAMKVVVAVVAPAVLGAIARRSEKSTLGGAVRARRG